MMRLALTPLLIAISFMLAGATAAMDKENTLYIDLKDGRVVIEMRPDLAPKHVAQIKKLAREGKLDTSGGTIRDLVLGPPESR